MPADRSITPLAIGSLTLPHGLLLAPMAGYTHPPFRTLCHRYGAAMTYTEVTNAAGLVYGSRRTWHLLETFEGEGPVAAHLYGHDPAIFAEAARMIEATGRFVAIDINCGCPVRKIVRKGAGAALMESPALIGRIVRAVVEAVALPVTVKTRIARKPGMTEDGLAIAQEAEANGAAALVIHGRATSQEHHGPVDWEGIARIAGQVAIPVIGNGGLHTAGQAVDAWDTGPIAGVMPARGAVGAPWLFRDILALMRDGTTPPPPGREERMAIIREHLAGLVILKERERLIRPRATLTAEAAAAVAFKPHWHQYLKGMHHWGDIRASINQVQTIPEILATTQRILDRQPDPGA